MNLLLPPQKKKHPTKTIPSFQVRAPSETKKTHQTTFRIFRDPKVLRLGLLPLPPKHSPNLIFTGPNLQLVRWRLIHAGNLNTPPGWNIHFEWKSRIKPTSNGDCSMILPPEKYMAQLPFVLPYHGYSSPPCGKLRHLLSPPCLPFWGIYKRLGLDFWDKTLRSTGFGLGRVISMYLIILKVQLHLGVVLLNFQRLKFHSIRRKKLWKKHGLHLCFV